MGKIIKRDEFYDENKINEISKMVVDGSLIIYPTDTVYGLGATIHNIESIDKIYTVKERSHNSPLIALLSGKKYLEKIAIVNDKNRKKIMKLIDEFWPGGLTIILEKKEIIPSNMVSNGDSVGVRIPDHEIALKLIENCGGILATTSANISGENTPKNFDDLSDRIKSRVDILIEDRTPLKGVESTIIDMRETPIILREGHIIREEIEKIIGKVN